jgi:hypothetical protein
MAKLEGSRLSSESSAVGRNTGLLTRTGSFLTLSEWGALLVNCDHRDGLAQAVVRGVESLAGIKLRVRDEPAGLPSSPKKKPGCGLP